MLGKLYELEHYLQESNICLAEKADFPPKSIASLLHKIEFKLESLCPVRDHISWTSMQGGQELFLPMNCEWK